MRIGAVMVWYDEPPHALERCLRSLVGLVDVLLTVDGRWKGHADDLPVASPLEQRERLADVAADLDGYFGTALAGERADPWESQVAKRASAYEWMVSHGDCEWLFVIDADEHVEHCMPYHLRERLQVMDDQGVRVGQVACRTVSGENASAGTQPIPRFFSTAEGLTVDRAHNGIRTTGGKWLAGDNAYVKLEAAADLSHELRIFHAQGVARTAERQAADRAYRRYRGTNRIESWRAGRA